MSQCVGFFRVTVHLPVSVSVQTPQTPLPGPGDGATGVRLVSHRRFHGFFESVSEAQAQALADWPQAVGVSAVLLARLPAFLARRAA